MKKVLGLFLALLASLSLISCSSINLEFGDVVNGVIDFIDEEASSQEVQEEIGDIEDINGIEEINEIEEVEDIREDGHYKTKEEVALYIHSFNKLPSNFITKKEAGDLGWESSKGNLWDVTDQKSIGGDRFGNREKRLPIKQGRTYYECDLNYEGAYRGAERIVYSNDGLVYYTGDHYESFTLLYGDEDL